MAAVAKMATLWEIDQMSSPIRRALIAGNWKMHLNLVQSAELAKAVRDGTKGSPAEVAGEIVSRFGGLVDRVGFYTPYLVADDTLGELVDALRHADQPDTTAPPEEQP